MPHMRPFLALLSVIVGVQAGAVSHGPAAARENPSTFADRPRGAIAFDPPPSAVPWLQGRGAAPAAHVVSRIRVTVPQADAEVLFESEPITTKGTNREWETPLLEPGRSYEYTFTARWRPNNYTVITRKKTVRFKAGDAIIVDMTTDDLNDRAEIRYVPTPDFVVEAMIKLAGITRNDVVYEPGCGDARITIAAVKAGARRGVGIDLDETRVADSRKQVSAAKLQDKIDIRMGDALDIEDLSEATVVFLYMGEEFDLLIRPILWKQLKIGARIVSHRFRMGDWMPDETVTVGQPTSDDVSLVHLWTITKEIKARAAKL